MSSSARANCTLFASPTGLATNSGISVNSAIPLVNAVKATQPGDTVCLLPGTYQVNTPFIIYNSGSAGNWITYTNYNNGVAVLTPKAGTQALMRLGPGIHYVQIIGLYFDGQNISNTAISCSGCDHLNVTGNHIKSMGAAGVITYPDPGTGKTPDYITVDHNQIYHSGYNQGFGSAISFRRHLYSDSYAGFHSFVTNNIISGMFDNSVYRTDGNAIIMDNNSGDMNPPVLIANNVIYQNGRRCIFERDAASNTWEINNTCYKNDLFKPAGELETLYATGVYAVNNISYSWNTSAPYVDAAPIVYTKYFKNQWLASGTGHPQVVPSTLVSDPAALIQADPRFFNPPYVSPTAHDQFDHAVPPEQISDQFYLQAGSPVIGAGIDPTTLPGLAPEIINGMKQYIYFDIEGRPRIPGSHFDLGAYVYNPPLATVWPVADSYVDSASPNINYGTSTTLRVGGAAIRTTFLKFDLTSLAGKSIHSAKLCIRTYTGGTGTYSANSVPDTTWPELGITYVNQPAIGKVLASATNPAPETWVEFDITAAVQSGLGKLMSFAITSTSSYALLMDSRELKYVKPQIVIR